MKIFRISFCFGYTINSFVQERCFTEQDFRLALNSLYVSFWGTPIFVISIKQEYKQ